MSVAKLPEKWRRKCGKFLLDAITFLVFLSLDFLDVVLCVTFKLFDEFFEGKTFGCYCGNKGENYCGEKMKELSETLFGGRENVFWEMGFLSFARKLCKFGKKRDDDSNGNGYGGELVSRWSDCGCDSCVSWMKKSNQMLHVVVKELPQEITEDQRKDQAAENVIFLHGFLSSSSFWTQTVLKNFSKPIKDQIYRFFAVDLLGFGRSPKPNDSLYTLNDHLEMIEKSVISPYQLDSFHLVAHSMGCIVALGLAAKHSKLVKSVTLVAPPYFPSTKDGTSASMVLNTVAGKTLWPPLAFGKSIMSWYEHVGRLCCFMFCKNHRTWHRILKLLTQRRELNFMEEDLTRHTHHSAWHSMHNVICGGSKLMDNYLEILVKSKAKLWVIHGDQDLSVPLKCSNDLKMKFPEVELKVIHNADHGSVILNREKDFAKSLGHVWASSYKSD